MVYYWLQFLSAKSLGTVTLNSPNFGDTPVIDPNFLSHEEDIHDVKCAINFLKFWQIQII